MACRFPPRLGQNALPFWVVGRAAPFRLPFLLGAPALLSGIGLDLRSFFTTPMAFRDWPASYRALRAFRNWPGLAVLLTTPYGLTPFSGIGLRPIGPCVGLQELACVL